MDPRHQSRTIIEAPTAAAARSYFKAVGFTDEDLARSIVGVVRPPPAPSRADAAVSRCRQAAPVGGFTEVSP